MKSAFTVAFFVVGNLIGSGFFIVPSLLAPIGGSLLYSWAITCSMAIIFALVFGRLYTLFPKVSVISDYFKNDKFKRIIAIVYWLSCVIGNTGVLIVLVASCNTKININILAGIFMLLLTVGNAFVKYSTIERSEAILSLSKFGILIILPIIFCVIQPDFFTMPEFKGTSSQVALLGISSIWAFLGIETAGLFGSGESARKGLLYGVIASSLLYICLSLFLVGCVEEHLLQSSNVPFALLAKKFLGPGSEKYISFLIAFTCFGSLYGWIAATGKMSLFFAKSGSFGKSFLKKTRSDISSYGLWISSLISFACFVAVSNMQIKEQFEFVANVCVYLSLALYGMCSLICFKNSKKNFDKITSILAIISVVASFAVSMVMLAIVCMTFFITWCYVKLFIKKA